MHDLVVGSSYDEAYRNTQRVIDHFDTSTLNGVLRFMVSIAQWEWDWGIVDALADSVQKRQVLPRH